MECTLLCSVHNNGRLLIHLHYRTVVRFTIQRRVYASRTPARRRRARRWILIRDIRSAYFSTRRCALPSWPTCRARGALARLDPSAQLPSWISAQIITPESKSTPFFSSVPSGFGFLLMKLMLGKPPVLLVWGRQLIIDSSSVMYSPSGLTHRRYSSMSTRAAQRPPMHRFLDTKKTSGSVTSFAKMRASATSYGHRAQRAPRRRLRVVRRNTATQHVYFPERKIFQQMFYCRRARAHLDAAHRHRA